MTDTTISDAIVFPQDDGTGVSDGSEDWNSAASFGILSRNIQGEYVGDGMGFANVDTVNNQVDVTAGHAYIVESGNTVQGGTTDSYDVTLPTGSDSVYVVVMPTDEANLSLSGSTNNDLYLAVDPTTNDNVYIRHGDDGTVSAPSDPHIKLGEVDTSDGSTFRPNDRPSLDAGSLSVSGQQVYDIVEQGADPSGSADISSTLSNLAGDNTTIVFPPGTYNLGSQFNDLSSTAFSNFAMVGIGQPTIEWNGTAGNTALNFSDITKGDGLIVRNLEIDMSNDLTGTPIEAEVADRGFVEDLKVTGRLTSDKEAVEASVGSEGTMYLRGLRLEDGADASAATGDGAQGIWVPADHAGTLIVEDANVVGFPNNGVYASAPNGSGGGKVVVRDSYAKNNSVADFRIGSDHSVVENCTVVHDNVPTGNGTAVRGVWVRSGANTRVENVHVDINGVGSGTGIPIHEDVVSTTIRNCDVEIDNVAGYEGIGAGPASGTRERVTIEGCSVTGNGNDANAIKYNATDGTIEDCWVKKDAAGTNVRGIWIDASCTIQNCQVQVVNEEAILVTGGQSAVRDCGQISGAPDIDVNTGVRVKFENLQVNTDVPNQPGVLKENLGTEAAGGGNPPSNSAWDEGDIVQNTSDNTFWVLGRNNSWHEI